MRHVKIDGVRNLVEGKRYAFRVGREYGGQSYEGEYLGVEGKGNHGFVKILSFRVSGGYKLMVPDMEIEKVELL